MWNVGPLRNQDSFVPTNQWDTLRRTMYLFIDVGVGWGLRILGDTHQKYKVSRVTVFCNTYRGTRGGIVDDITDRVGSLLIQEEIDLI